jgi:hypothetical protein
MGPETARIMYEEGFGTDTSTEKLTELTLQVMKNTVMGEEEECDNPEFQTFMHDFIKYVVKAYSEHITRERGRGQLLQAINEENAQDKSNNHNGKTETDTIQKELEEASLTQQHSSIQSSGAVIIEDNSD